MRIVKLPKKEFRERFGDILGSAVEESGEKIAYVPEGASTSSILHEVGHIERGDTLGVSRKGARRYAESELGAEEYSGKLREKDPELSGESIANIIRRMLNRGYRPSNIYNAIISSLVSLGYNLDSNYKREIREYVESEAEELK